MVEPLSPFDPEFESILREVASDPHSSLLKVPRSRAVESILAGDVVRPSRTGLTSLERHLLQCHRAELAFRLRQACLLKLEAREAIHARWIGHVDGTTRIERQGIRRWRSETATIPPQELAASELDPGELLLQAAIANGLEQVSVAQLAAASERLEPREAARIYVGMDLLSLGDPRGALRVMSGTPSPTSRDIDAVAGACWRGAAHEALKELDRALALHEEAHERQPSSFLPLLNCFIMAALMRDAQAMSKHGAALDRLIPHDHPVVGECVANLATKQSSEPPALIPHGEPGTAKPFNGTPSERILHALS